mmetsp:Transcript_7645/g.8641  ORF Transcript_7645/g.8641 Transcript_7645/m.8641 type:complete len:137 (+) Transcript_7645:3-413(+)
MTKKEDHVKAIESEFQRKVKYFESNEYIIKQIEKSIQDTRNVDGLHNPNELYESFMRLNLTNPINGIQPSSSDPVGLMGNQLQIKLSDEKSGRGSSYNIHHPDKDRNGRKLSESSESVNINNSQSQRRSRQKDSQK